MKTYNSMYLGICVNNNDPEKRGRVQIFIPHIMPALYTNWNEAGQDIEITCVGDNMPQGLTGEMIQKLTLILPWAEAASPIIGSSAPGTLVGAVMGAAGAIGEAAGRAAAAVGSAAKAVISQVYEQSPAAEPADIGDLNGLLNEAANYAGKDARGDKVRGTYRSSRGGRNCGRGTHGVLGALTGGKIPGGPLGGNANDFGAGGRMDFTKSGLYQPKQAPPANYLNDPSQWKVGDVVANGGGKPPGYGHIQVWTGKSWVSDFTQGNQILNYSNYHSFALHRPNAAGDAVIAQRAAGLIGNGASTKNQEAHSMSGEVAAASPHQKSDPLDSNPNSNSYGNIANPNVTAGPPGTGAPAGTVSGKGTVSETGISKGALEYAMRIAAAETGAIGKPGSGKGTASYISNVNNTIAMSQGIKNGYEVRGVSFSRINEIAETLKSQGKVNPNVLDIGYTQHNANDGKAYGIVNSGSYKDQILSVARHVQNQANKNPAFASYLNQRQFTQAEAMNKGKIVPGWNTSIYKAGTHIANKNALSNDITTKYGGDPYAALEALNKEYPPTDTLETMLGPNYVPPGGQSWSPPGGAGGSGGSTGKPVSMVQNVDPHGATVTQNLNNMAKGLFSFPAAGSMLWVFFRDGNPLFPVYFAASYSQSEWASVYRLGSDGPGYRPVATPENPMTSTGGVMNLNGVGGLRWEATDNPPDRLKDQKSIMFFGEDGSNIFMGKGYNQYFSKFDRRDQVEGDRWETTLGNKEEWVQADKNVVVMGDVFVKVGNVSQTAVDAVERMQQILEEIHKPMTESSGGGGGSGGSGSEKLPDNVQKAIDDKRKEMEKSWGMTEDPGKFKMQTENKVPGYLQAGASQSTIDKFRSDSNALQAQRNKQTFQNMQSFSNAGTATTGLKGVPSTITVQPGQLRGSTVPSVGFSTGPGLTIR